MKVSVQHQNSELLRGPTEVEVLTDNWEVVRSPSWKSPYCYSPSSSSSSLVSLFQSPERLLNLLKSLDLSIVLWIAESAPDWLSWFL